jgi:tRNA-dihydrouridine synthase
LELCSGLVELGAKALTVHGRTKEHFYTGEVKFPIIRAVREAFPDIPVIANGGVNSRESYDKMRQETGCSRVMLAQGIMGNPWLFSELANNALPPTIVQWREMVHFHVSEMVTLYGEASAMRQARKIVHDYLKGRGFPAILRAKANTLNSMKDLDELLASADIAQVSGTIRKILI